MHCKRCQNVVYSDDELWEVRGSVRHFYDFDTTSREYSLDAGVFCTRKCAGEYLLSMHDQLGKEDEPVPVVIPSLTVSE